MLTGQGLNPRRLVWEKTVERNRERLMKKFRVPLGRIDLAIAFNIKKLCARPRNEDMDRLIKLLYGLTIVLFEEIEMLFVIDNKRGCVASLRHALFWILL